MFYTNRSLLLSKLVKLVIKKKLTFGGINCHRYQNKKRKLVMNSCWGKKKKSSESKWMSGTADTLQNWLENCSLKTRLFQLSPKSQDWCFLGNLVICFHRIKQWKLSFESDEFSNTVGKKRLWILPSTHNFHWYWRQLSHLGCIICLLDYLYYKVPWFQSVTPARSSQGANRLLHLTQQKTI